MSKKFKELINKEDLQKRIAELGYEISNDFKDETVTLVCVLKGAVMFFTDLSKNINVDVIFDFLDVSSYGDSTISSGVVKINKDLEFPITGKNVIVVEDIIDTGYSLEAIKKHLESQNPKTLKFCTLLDKPLRRETDYVIPDYVGFEIPDEFVVGYGLDDKQIYRNLDYIGIVD